jgi:DsbC/DsbD-like thiol-disulfide interchange protein
MKLLIGILVTTAALLGQTPSDGSKPASVETRHARIATSSSAAEIAPGGKLSLFADVTPKPKMHVYAPGQQDYLVVSLTLDKNDAIAAGAAKYPTPEKLFFEPLNETQLVYSRLFRITQPLTIARTAAAGSLTIKGTLRYQACDDAVCYLPATVTLTWVVRVKGS